MSDKIWKILSDKNKVENPELQLKLNIDNVLSNLLNLRGVTNYEIAEKFFRPNLSELHNPF